MIIEREGIDGTVKTTQCRLLKAWFEKNNKAATIVKALESTQLGRQIKSFLTTDAPRTKEVELFCFLSCSSHLQSEAIIPEVAKGVHIICDRGIGSFLSYFEVAGFSPTLLGQFLSTALPVKIRTTTVLLDIDVQEALRRNTVKPGFSKFDNMGTDFFEKQRQVYLRLADENHWIIIDGTNSTEKVHELITSKITGE